MKLIDTGDVILIKKKNPIFIPSFGIPPLKPLPLRNCMNGYLTMCST